MDAGTIRATLVALALAGFVAAVVVLGRSPDAPRTPAAAEPTRDEPPPDEPIPEVVPDDPPAIPKPVASTTSRGDVVLPGLRWLQSRQSPDGSWHDPATTGLALLAFLGAGHTPQTGSFRATVKDGLKHLRDVQDAEGCLVPRDSPRMLRDHAISALALVEAYGMTGNRVFKEPAQRAVAFALEARASAGWSPPDFDDTTVWMSMLVKSAKLSGLDVDDAPLAAAVTAVDRMTDRTTGRVVAPYRGLSVEAATAMGMLVRKLAGHHPDTDDAIRLGADLLAVNPPRWERGRLADPDAWYFGTIALSSLYRAHWKSWAEAMTAVMDKAAASGHRGDLLGSWDPPGASPSERERIWTTAFVLLGAERAFYAYKVFVK